MESKRFRVSKEIEFDYAHRIQDHKSKCKNIHGHRGKLIASISGPLQEQGSSKGMVLDFSDIKSILMDLHEMWDHGFLVEYNDPFIKAINAQRLFGPDLSIVGLEKVYRCGFSPTAENIAAFAFSYIKKQLSELYLGTDISLESVTFFETPTSSATVTN